MTRSALLIALAPLLLLSACSGGDGSSIEASGTIEGTDVTVASEVTGKVLSVRVNEGARVHVGDTLAVVDNTEYAIQLRQARASQGSQEASYRLVLEGSRREDILQSETAYRTAEADYKRMKDLVASNTVTQKQYDDAYNRYVTAEQTYQKLLTGSRKQEVEAARARVESAAAQADLLEKKVRDCVMTAPAEGTVTLRGIEPGEFVTPGTPVFRITNLDRVKLMIYVAESDLGKIRTGQEASIFVDSHPDRAFPGTIVYLSPVAEFTPKNVQTKEERTKLVFAVKVEADNPEGILKPGMPADARVRIAR
jgi:HlyD family secretion protein